MTTLVDIQLFSPTKCPIPVIYQLPENFVGPPVMSGKFDGSTIKKHQNTEPTERQNLAVLLTLNNIPLKVNKNSFPV